MPRKSQQGCGSSLSLCASVQSVVVPTEISPRTFEPHCRVRACENARFDGQSVRLRTIEGLANKRKWSVSRGRAGPGYCSADRCVFAVLDVQQMSCFHARAGLAMLLGMEEPSADGLHWVFYDHRPAMSVCEGAL